MSESEGVCYKLLQLKGVKVLDKCIRWCTLEPSTTGTHTMYIATLNQDQHVTGVYEVANDYTVKFNEAVITEAQYAQFQLIEAVKHSMA